MSEVDVTAPLVVDIEASTLEGADHSLSHDLLDPVGRQQWKAFAFVGEDYVIGGTYLHSPPFFSLLLFSSLFALPSLLSSSFLPLF